MAPVGRFNAELSEDAHQALRRFAARNGVSMSGLLEALALALPSSVPDDIVERARVIDAERRERG